MNLFLALFKLNNCLDKRKTFYQYLLFLRINFFGFYRNTLLYAYVAKIVQNRSIAYLPCWSLEKVTSAKRHVFDLPSFLAGAIKSIATLLEFPDVLEIFDLIVFTLAVINPSSRFCIESSILAFPIAIVVNNLIWEKFEGLRLIGIEETSWRLPSILNLNLSWFFRFKMNVRTFS